jgi:CheY-like chemotaxis protein
MDCHGVLLVEDDQDIRETVQMILEDEGYLVYTAANGLEALKVLKSVGHPCLILLDLMMPVMNGWQFLEERKKDNLVAGLPVVVVSAVADESQSDHSVKFLRKPPDIDALLRVVGQYTATEPLAKVA